MSGTAVRINRCPLCPEEADNGGYVYIGRDYRGFYVDEFECDGGEHDLSHLDHDQTEQLYEEAIDAR